MIRQWWVLIFAMLAPAAGSAPPRPEPVKLEIVSSEPAFGGRSFGERGPYERITAVARMRIDPRAPGNRRIVDLALAPLDRDGLVAYDVDLVILRPRDAARARRVILYEVVNRGSKSLSSLNNGQATAAGADPIDAGDGLLMREGYTMVWSGWQGDVSGRGMIGARFPIATSNGRPITGPVSTETIFDDGQSDRINLAYPAHAPSRASAVLTVRARSGDRPTVIPASDWKFETDRQVSLKRPAGFDAGAIYRFQYVARDPKVMGLGFAATRDLISFLRHGSAAAGNPLADLAGAPCERDARGQCANPGGGAISTAVALGGSQSGRYLRDLIWQGFNRDLAGRLVFDGMIPYIAGGRQTFTNFRFAEPSRFSRQHEDHDVPGFVFPFTYATIADPVTGRRDGILRACAADGTCPRIFHLDSSAEFWQAGASLVGTGGTGRDIAFPANVRAYMIAGGAHAPGRTAPACSLPANPMGYTPVLRALTVAMVDWASGRGTPPASRWPTLGETQSVDALETPEVAAHGLRWPKVVNAPVSPVAARQWPVRVPTVDDDGNDIAGIRMPEIAAPTGTYLPWNVRRPGFAEGQLCLVYGGYVPFAPHAGERRGDRRLSLFERYPDPRDRGSRYTQSVEALQRQGFLLREDVAILANRATTN